MKKQLKDIVHQALKINPIFRDSDHKLVGYIWGLEIEDEFYTDVLYLLSVEKLTNWESIARCRRKIQEENPDLRGNSWEEKQSKSVEVAIDMVNYKPTL